MYVCPFFAPIFPNRHPGIPQDHIVFNLSLNTIVGKGGMTFAAGMKDRHPGIPQDHIDFNLSLNTIVGRGVEMLLAGRKDRFIYNLKEKGVAFRNKLVWVKDVWGFLNQCFTPGLD
ncbi:hypothetical protein CEXT_642031 [Caerostris extrusa]|uniref:Uncharacterized protein n=1 Tax=Caerostris extrusa TaxID=172846 RepID=A0AAV4Q8N5_CAEEX|nr:hypothetical protein CEXT_642031 [Caerostris extrusa]